MRLWVAEMNHDRAKQLIAEAKKIARQADSWISLSNALSDPQGGLIAWYFPDSDQRHDFVCSPEYQELDQLLVRIIKRKGLYPHAASRQNGIKALWSHP